MNATDFLALVVRRVDRLNETVGCWVSWLTITMVLTTFSVAVLRYGFEVGWIWLQELYVWMHGTIIMVAAGYTLLHDGHVRVDIFYRSASTRFKAWVDLFGVLFLLFPTLAVIWWGTWPYVLLSWLRLEESREAGGMQGLYILKTTMLAFCILLALQGLALVLCGMFVLMGRPLPEAIRNRGQRGM